jgi:hypothetical protein
MIRTVTLKDNACEKKNRERARTEGKESEEKTFKSEDNGKRSAQSVTQ